MDDRHAREASIPRTRDGRTELNDQFLPSDGAAVSLLSGIGPSFAISVIMGAGSSARRETSSCTSARNICVSEGIPFL